MLDSKKMSASTQKTMSSLGISRWGALLAVAVLGLVVALGQHLWARQPGELRRAWHAHPQLQRIDVNRAPRQELRTLPGVGPVTAERLVQHRSRHGPFASPRDLERVRGIGPKTRTRLSPWIACGAP